MGDLTSLPVEAVIRLNMALIPTRLSRSRSKTSGFLPRDVDLSLTLRLRRDDRLATLLAEHIALSENVIVIDEVRSKLMRGCRAAEALGEERIRGMIANMSTPGTIVLSLIQTIVMLCKKAGIVERLVSRLLDASATTQV